MKINLKGWHKIASDKTHTTMRDPKGHELRVCHRALSRPHRDALEKLPVQMAEGGMIQSMAKGGMVQHYAEGGMADEEMSSQMPSIPSPDEQAQSIQESAEAQRLSPDQERVQNLYNIDIAAKQMGDPNDPGAMDSMLGGGQAPQRIDPVSLQKAQLGAQSEKLADAERQQKGMQDIQEQNALRAQVGLEPLPVPPELSPAGVQPAVSRVSARIATDLSPPEPQMGPNEPQQGTGPTGMDRVRSGMEQQAAAMQQQAARDMKTFQAQEQHMVQAEAEFKNQWTTLEEQRKTIQEELRNDKINPNRFWDNMNVGQRIGTAIGMILGGIGGGMTHQENPAMAMINKAIGADIEAQKANLGKKENLLAANLRQFGNVKDAMTVTRLMQNDAVLNKLKMSMAQAQGPQAKAMLAQEIGKLEAQQGAVQQKFALEKTIANQVEKDPSSFPTLLQQIRAFDPKRAHELEEQYVPGMGIALTGKDATSLKELKGTVDTAKDGLMRLRAITFKPGRSLSPVDRAEAETVAQSLIGLLRVPITGPGAMSEGERAMLEKLVANPTAVFSLDSSTRMRLSTLSKRLDQSLAMAGRARGITSYDPANSLDPQQKAYVTWARQNKQDPRATLVLQKLGLE